jgi:hypothetical protein
MTKTLDSETIEKASEIASSKAIIDAMKSIPKTVAGMDKTFH